MAKGIKCFRSSRSFRSLRGAAAASAAAAAVEASPPPDKKHSLFNLRFFCNPAYSAWIDAFVATN